MFSEDEAVMCSVLRVLKLKAAKMQTGKAGRDKVTGFDAA